jgi:hypothetical protein
MAPSSPTAPIHITNTSGNLGTGIVNLTTINGRLLLFYQAGAYFDNRSSAPLTVRMTINVMDANGTVYATTSGGCGDATIPAGGNAPVCGRATDYSFAHPVATTLRGSLAVIANGQPLQPPMDLGDAPIMSTGLVLPQRLVIEQFRTRGPNGPTDQFVELFNDSISPAVVDGSLGATPSNNALSQSITIRSVAIGPLCHLLSTAPGYSGSVPGDIAMPAMLTDDGAIGFSPSNFALNIVPDTVRMNSIGNAGEGNALPPFGSENSDRSYARTGIDTNDNAHDFAMIRPSTPRNSSMCGPRATTTTSSFGRLSLFAATQ